MRALILFPLGLAGILALAWSAYLLVEAAGHGVAMLTARRRAARRARWPKMAARAAWDSF